MESNIFHALIFVIVYFGIYCFLVYFDVKSMDMKKEEYKNIYMVLFVKNAEGTIEQGIRTLKKDGSLWRIQNKIPVVDMGSSDDTMAILSKMAQNDPRLEVFQFDAGQDVFSKIHVT
jgi:hypothetical protein